MKTSKDMTNAQIATLLRAIAAAYTVLDEDQFRIRAYDTAAEAIEKTTIPLKDLWQQHQLQDIPGVGASIAGHLEELFTPGRVKHFDQLTKKLPPAMFEILDVPGIGPKTAYKLADQLKLRPGQAKAQLLQAAQAQRVRTLEGFAAQSEQDLIHSLKTLPQAHAKRILLIEAQAVAERVIAHLRQVPGITHIDPLGSLRRRNATVGDIDIAVATIKPQLVIRHFLKYPHAEVLAAGDNTARIIDHNGYQIDVKTVPPDNYGALLQHFTGSKTHNIHLRELALQQGWSLSEYGIKVKGRLKPYATETEFYQALGLPWIPPELREDAGEIEAALRQAQGKPHGLPDLIQLSDIKGDLHTHTNFDWSPSHDPGLNSIEEIVQAALKLGYAYIGIGDHNPSLSVYKTPERLITEVQRRTQAIEHIKSKYENKVKNSTIKVLNSLEVDIRSDGSLALPDQALDLLDFAVVSVHSVFNLDETAMTQRIIRGLSHPKVKVLGHPTGRLLNKRPAYDVDWPKVFAFCREQRKALEVNAHPHRLDLPDTLIRQAIQAGVKLVINTDSHDISHLFVMTYGVDTARRGWATPNDIINTWPWDKFADFVLK